MKINNYLALILWIILVATLTSCKKEYEEPIHDNSVDLVTTNSLTGNTVRFIGRWANNYCGWGGAYARVQFSGTSVKIQFADKTTNYYFIKIDNGKFVRYTISTPSTITIKTIDGIHSLVVMQGKDSHYQSNIVNITGALLPITKRKWIEYVGDSITAGWLDSAANVSSYTRITSDALQVDYTEIAYPGITLVNGMDNQYFKATCNGTSDWSFTNYKPDIIVINLGTNDQNRRVSDADFKKSYIRLINNIRDKLGNNIQIFLMRPFNGAKASVIQSVITARQNASDYNTQYINTSGWLEKEDFVKDGLHPNDEGQHKAAVYLEGVLNFYVNSIR